MNVVTVSPKYQVVIPVAIRRALNIRPGQRVEVRERDGRVELEPLTPMSTFRGFLPGIETDIPNDDE